MEKDNIKTQINYGSKMQSITNQDIEFKQFNSKYDAFVYLNDRIDFEDKNTVYVYFYKSDDDEYLEGHISRNPDAVLLYLEAIMKHSEVCLNVFECESYLGALNYLNLYFETSSLY